MSENFQTIREQIENILFQAFAPELLEVTDDSDRHVGHAGHNGIGESHFKVKIISSQFQGKSSLQKHRMIYAALGAIISRIHALEIEAS